MKVWVNSWGDSEVKVGVKLELERNEGWDEIRVRMEKGFGWNQILGWSKMRVKMRFTLTGWGENRVRVK